MRTQVGIVGAGPAGLLLAHLLAHDGVDSVVLERRDRDYVEQRVRAGVLEHSTAQLLSSCGVGERMRREGLVHHGIELRFDRQRHRVPLTELAGDRSIIVYGQQEVVKDLIAARLAAGRPVLFGTESVGIENLDAADPGGPRIRFEAEGGEPGILDCDVVAGCDGSHGVCRAAVARSERVLVREYPFAWLGILAAVPPSTEELIYCRSDRGFALHSMRSPELSRLYLQVRPGEPLDEWPDGRIWEELAARLATDDGWTLSEGPILERSVTDMRGFVVEPMRYGSLFLAGDAAHVVPPTGAKGMNLAVADVRLLAEGLVRALTKSDDRLLDEYSARCLRRAWRAQEFSAYMTTMLHPLPGEDFNSRLQTARLDHLVHSEAALRSLAENYVDLTGT
ncbi:MAG: 4-hydroxybenzoate 3-monooxygenase [Acidimicrobiales bacterium]